MNDNINIKILELENVDAISEDSLTETSINNAGEYNSKKISLTQLSDWECNEQEHNQLKTDDKTIVGAINELIDRKGDLYIGVGAAAHNAIYRGKCLGAAPTPEQYANIKDGTFNDLFIGDFWSNDPENPEETRWRIAGFDYYYGTGEGVGQECFEHHAVIIPDNPIVLDGSGIVSGPGFAAQGGYLYSDVRGYQYEELTISLPVEIAHDGVYDFNVPYKPAWGVISIDSIEGLKCQDLELVEGENKLHFFNRLATLPIGTEVKIHYRHFVENYGGLASAKNIITEIFDEKHLLEHNYRLAYSSCSVDYYWHYSGTCFKTKEIRSSVEIPTVPMIIGNDFLTYNGENAIHYGWKYARINYSIYENNSNQINNNENYETYQLPLFKYDPSLIHTRYGYWFREKHSNDSVYNYENTLNSQLYPLINYNFNCRYVRMEPYGFLNADNNYQPLRVGIRPVFCLKGGENNE